MVKNDDPYLKYLDFGPQGAQAQLPPPYAEDISAFLTLILSYKGLFGLKKDKHDLGYASLT